MDTGEQCDDGNDDETDDCLADCTLRDSGGLKPGGCGCQTDTAPGSLPAAPLLWGLLLLGLLIRRRRG